MLKSKKGPIERVTQLILTLDNYKYSELLDVLSVFLVSYASEL